HVYISDPARIELIPGAAAAIAEARAAGYLVVVVTNQSGIGRGIIDPLAMPFIHSRLDILLSGAGGPGAQIDRYEICVHHPNEDCACRKPKPYLVQEAARALDIDISRSIFVGDKLTDVGTGKSAGCRHSILVRTGKGIDEEALLANGTGPAGVKPDLVVDSLGTAVEWVLSNL
ncbi:MAG: HAD-IIIA family hydrolase, partial [Proteobacteria bacterium]